MAFVFLMAVAAGALVTLATYGLRHYEAFAAEWKPTSQLEIIIPTSPGSGVDNTRIIRCERYKPYYKGLNSFLRP